MTFCNWVERATRRSPSTSESTWRSAYCQAFSESYRRHTRTSVGLERLDQEIRRRWWGSFRTEMRVWTWSACWWPSNQRNRLWGGSAWTWSNRGSTAQKAGGGYAYGAVEEGLALEEITRTSSLNDKDRVSDFVELHYSTGQDESGRVVLDSGSEGGTFDLY